MMVWRLNFQSTGHRVRWGCFPSLCRSMTGCAGLCAGLMVWGCRTARAPRRSGLSLRGASMGRPLRMRCG